MQSVLSSSRLLIEPQNVDFALFKHALNEAETYYEGGDLSDLGIDSIDCCGTGGSGQSKFNYSTACAFILNAGGMKVTKFGNRSATGTSGSQDFLDVLGITNSVSVSSTREIFDKVGIVFLNARNFYRNLSQLAKARKQLGRPTVLNYIAPLLNPCKPRYRLLGVSNERMQLFLTDLLKKENSLEKAVLVRSQNNLDELVPFGKNHIVEINQSRAKSYELNISSREYQSPKDLATPRSNRDRFYRILKGEDSTSAIYNALVLNAGAGFYACHKVASIDDGIRMSKELIKYGDVLNTLEKTRSAYNEYSR